MAYYDGENYHASVNGFKIGVYKTLKHAMRAIDEYKNKKRAQA